MTNVDILSAHVALLLVLAALSGLAQVLGVTNVVARWLEGGE